MYQDSQLTLEVWRSISWLYLPGATQEHFQTRAMLSGPPKQIATDIEVRSPTEAKGFFSSSLCVQTGSGAHPASCTMGNGGPLPWPKARPGRDADHSPPSSAEVENE
jgi:hypothetical protein